ncbi:MAG TPA: isochorismatase family protein [Acidimicrobiia bacterium]|jgi:nicotinamidase/pyrazinamidase
MGYDLQTALLVVDVQNDFASPDGSLYVAGGEDVVDFINDEVAAAEDAGALVVYTQDWHPASTPHFAKDGGNWPVHCVADTWGADFHSGLDVVGPSVRKGTEGEDGYSGFTVRDTATGVERPTGLEGLLRDQDITRVVVVGLATDYCVKETVLDALEAGFAVTVVADGIRAVEVTPGDGAKAVEEMAAAGAVIA